MGSASGFFLRASSAHVWVRCTGWHRMQTADMPELTDPQVRDEGTAAHWAALMIWLGHRIDVGQRVQIDGMQHPVVVDDEMIDGIDDYLTMIRSWRGQPRLEYQVTAPRIHAACGGTCDAWSYDPQTKTLYVADLKFGYRWVDVYGNWPLLVYVCGLLDHLGIVDDREVTVVMAICQPRAYRGATWRYWQANAADLRVYFNQLASAASEAMSMLPKCRTGEHCNNCDARLTCDTFDAAVENALDVVSEPINNELTAQRTDSELLRVSKAFEIIEARKSALEARAEMFLRQGVQLSHHELSSGRSKRRWLEGMEPALGAMEQTMNVKLFKRTPITPTQAIKVLGESMVEGLSERPPAGMKLVRVDETKAARRFGQIKE